MNLPQKPYRGLESFRYADRDIFSEREDEKYHLVSLIEVYRGCLLYGQSGTGKSSLIAAGLIPLIENNYQAEIIRVFPNADAPFIVSRIDHTENEGDFLPSLFEIPDLKAEKIHVGLDKFKEIIQLKKNGVDVNARQLADAEQPAQEENKTSLLIFDQFEELITLFEEADPRDKEKKKLQKELQKEIIALLRSLYYDATLNIKLMFVFREDYLAKFEKLFEALPDLNDRFLRLTPVPFDRLEAIIRYPFEQFPDKYENEFPKEFCKDLAKIFKSYFRVNVNLTEVQVVCLSLYNKPLEERKKILGLTNPIKSVLQEFYLGILTQFDEKENETAIFILSVLVLNERTRNIYPHDGIIEAYLKQNKKNEADAVKRKKCETVLEKLDQKGIIRTETRDDGKYYEIRSESIIPFINEKKIERIKNEEFAKRRRKRGFIVLAIIIAIIGVAWYAIWHEGEKHRKEMDLRAHELKDAQNEIERQIRDAREDSLDNVRKANQRADSINLSTQKLQLKARQDSLNAKMYKNKVLSDSIRTLVAIDSVRNVYQQRIIDQERADMESENRRNMANYLAKLSLSQAASDSLEKTTLAKLAYDTLTAMQKNVPPDFFDPDIYSALVDGLLANFKSTKYSRYPFFNLYSNIENISAGISHYYLSVPFNYVTNENNTVVYSNKNLVHAWASPDNAHLAVVLINSATKIKTLVISNPGKGDSITGVSLGKDEDVVSVIFDAATSACIYSTRAPFNGEAGCVYRLKMAAAQKPLLIHKCDKNEYVLLSERPAAGFLGVTNLGRYIAWNDFTNCNKTDDKKIFDYGSPVSAICYDKKGNILYVGNEAARIYTLQVNGKPELFSSGDESAKITRMAIDDNGRWLAAGFASGSILLWKLDAKASPATILKNNDCNNQRVGNSITGLCIDNKENVLVASSRYGFLYRVPLFTGTLINKICNEKKFFQNANDWNSSDIPKSIKFKKLCKK